MKAENYDFFLFCKIAKYKIEGLSQLSSDIEFKKLVDLFNQYNKSHFTNITKSKISCIEAFFNQNQKQSFISNMRIILDLNSQISECDTLLIDELEEEIAKYKNIIRLLF